MRCTVMLAARGVIRDTTTNTISVFSIVEELRTEIFPAIMPELTVLAIWRRDAADPDGFDLQFTAMANDQPVGPPTAVRVSFAADSEIHRTLVTLNGLLIRQPGELVFRFARPGDSEVLASYHVPVPAAQAQVREKTGTQPVAATVRPGSRRVSPQARQEISTRRRALAKARAAKRR